MKQILWFIKTYFTFVILFSIQKPFFMILEKASTTQPIDNIWSEMPTVVWSGTNRCALNRIALHRRFR